MVTDDDFDLSQIPDTRRSQSSPSASVASLPHAEQPPAAKSRKRKMKTTTTRANSKKKRTADHSIDNDDNDAEPRSEHTPEPEPQDEQTRLAEEILMREERRRIREKEPEMFGDYAMSDDSELDAKPHAHPGLAGIADVRDEVEHERRVEADSEMEEREVTEPEPAPVDPKPEDMSVLASTSINSVFDDEHVQSLVEETPVVKQRKRKHQQAGSPESTKKQKSSKNRKMDTPPTSPSPAPDDITIDNATGDAVPEHPASNDVSKTIRRQSSMQDYAQPFAKSSALRHPVYNPRSPEDSRSNQGVEVVIPMSTASPSTARYENDQNAEPQPSSSRRPSSGLKRRTKPIDTPAMNGASQGRHSPWDVEAQPDPPGSSGIAKTIAKRTLQQENDSESDYGQLNEESTESMRNVKEQQKRAVKGKGKEPANLSRSRSSTPRAPKGPYTHRCPICSSLFPTEALLEKHRQDPTTHDDLIDCRHCEKQFATRAGLARHQKAQGHGTGNGLQGKTGRFSAEEEDRIERWRDQFCNDYGLNHYEFNEIMTASGKQGNATWPYKFISRKEFTKDYYDVLPERNVRSMRRYRERFQNVDRSREFTADDDAEIISLVAQLGQKWNEIGDQLTRDPEILRQRWKNKLRFGGKGKTLKTGTWDAEEHARFKDAIKEMRRITISAGIEDVDSFNWGAVSGRVKSRSAQQCANHWRAMHGKSVNGVWVDSGLSRVMREQQPSKMEKRLAGANLSKARIEDSDEEATPEREKAEQSDVPSDEDSDDKPDDSEDDAARSESEGQESGEQEVSDKKKTPRRQRKPVIQQDKTPGNRLTASQVFEQTQANTSTIKNSQMRGKTSQTQPSPGIALQVRPDSSPELGRKLKEMLAQPAPTSGEDDSEDYEVDENQEETTSNADAEGPEEDADDESEAQEASTADADSATGSRSEDEGESDPDDSDSIEAEQSTTHAFAAVNGHKQDDAGSDDVKSDAQRITNIFKNAASPNTKVYSRKKREAKKAKDFRWPEEQDEDSGSDGLGVDNLPR
ncbi:uncharacterized protein HMPREF1541_01752 [Cyphellophora europaea CBS 101466]|uniref:Uncharacterized protein n=1 Tax=Cyphellophora europaea (strain CBS 101466) TaxID=1220924 RepID=W2S1Y8_CYPE1|nr:uncharacterized protein HMPREF1541_01752 [Cyphellophora europaea CBS 101466]ETN42595.1 hypothetical protein HMPREF1541_01752 [Cyphellophora europaea CBS 101466]